MRMFALQARGKGLTLELQLAPDLPDALRGDYTRIGQVLTNLVGNAIKFTERGGVVLEVRKAGEADGVVRVAFSVRDTGIGIEAAQLGMIFDAFSQADASTSRRYGGTGLGLSISRRLVGLMGGALSVDSRPGEGVPSYSPFPCRRHEGLARPQQCAADRSALEAPAARCWHAPRPVCGPAPGSGRTRERGFPMPYSMCGALVALALGLPLTATAGPARNQKDAAEAARARRAGKSSVSPVRSAATPGRSAPALDELSARRRTSSGANYSGSVARGDLRCRPSGAARASAQASKR